MVILQLITRGQLRGAEIFAAQLSNYLEKKKNTVLIYGILPSKTVMPNIKVLDILKDKPLLISVKAINQIDKIVKINNVDIVQANASITLKYSVLSKLVFGWKAPIVYRNASISSYWMRSYFHFWFNRWLLGKVDKICCVSKASIKDLRDNFGIGSRKLVHIPNAVPVTKVIISDIREELKIESKVKILIHVGEFSPEKNHRGLLEIFRVVRLMMPDIILICVGEGRLKKKMINYAKELNLSNGIHFLGFRRDASNLIEQSDVLLLTSLIEGLPGVLLEAGNVGVPAVAYNVGAISEAIPPSFHKYIIPAGDQKDYVLLLKGLLKDNNEYNNYSHAFRKFVKKSFNLVHIGNQFLESYKESIALNEN